MNELATEKEPGLDADGSSPPRTWAGLTGREVSGLILLLTLALLVRLLFLGRAELWQDEIGFVNILTTHWENAWVAFLRYWQYVIGMAQMPFAGVLQNLYIRALVSSGIADAVYRPGLMRLPMALLGTAAVGGLFFAARRARGAASGWTAAALMAFSFFPVFYSREAYCYAHILFFSAWGLAAWMRLYEEGGWRSFLVASLCFAGMALSHLGAMVALAGWGAAAGVMAGVFVLRREAPGRTRRAFAAVGATAAGFLAGAPYLLHFMRHNTAHVGTGKSPSFLTIVNDVLAKTFLGEWPPAALLAWLIAAWGLYVLLRGARASWRQTGGLLAIATLLSLVLLTFATLRTQYISARYFSALAPFLYLLYAEGLLALADRVARWWRLTSDRGRAFCRAGLVSLFLLPHAALFLPLYWPLESKDEPFGWVAGWLNENLPPGSIYQLESAYQYRFLGGYYKTPNLFPLAPYVQGEGTEELRRLQEIQADVCRRFPEAVFIALGHPGWDHPDRPWEWPARHFRQRVILRNDALHRLIRTGIYPCEPQRHRPLRDFHYRFDIYFNTVTDRIAIARETGSGVLFDYPGWMPQGQPVSPAEVLYFRTVPGRHGTLVPVNVSEREQPGRIVLRVAVTGEPGAESEFQVLWNDEPLYAARHAAGNLFEVRTRPVLLPPGGHQLVLRSMSGDPSGSLILWDARWEPSHEKSPR